MEPLYKTRLRTRLLETREVIGQSVARATLRCIGKAHVVLDTVAITLLVALRQQPSRGTIDLPVNGSIFPVTYVTKGNRHELTIAATDVDVRVQALGKGRLVIKKQRKASV